MITDRRRTVVVTVATGVIVGNNYYAQPLAAPIAATFHASSAAVGTVLTVVQLSYAVGIALLVPLGDLVECRRLVVTMLAVTTVGQLVVAVSPALTVLGAAAALVAVTAAAAQVLVAFTRRLAPAGRVAEQVGAVTSGLILGMVLARVVGGLVAEPLGWRAVFALGAVLTAAVAVTLWRVLPPLPPTVRLTYAQLLRSAPRLVREQPALRWLLPCGASAFAALAAVWTSIGFLLARPPHLLSEREIGLFALFGVAGALAGRRAGKIADVVGPARVVSVSLPAVVVAMLGVGAGTVSLPALALGLVVFDAGVQATNIATRTMVMNVDPEAPSRLNAVYGTACFGGAALGSGAAAAGYAAYGWVGVSVVAAVFPAAGWCVWLVSRSGSSSPA